MEMPVPPDQTTTVTEAANATGPGHQMTQQNGPQLMPLADADSDSEDLSQTT